MKVTVLKTEKNKNNNIINSILLLILGIIFITNPNTIISLIFTIIGSIITLYGILNLIKAINNQDEEYKRKAILNILIGVIIIILSNVIAGTIQTLTGIFLIFIGLSKLGTNNTNYNLISSLIIIILGIYTIIAKNIVFIILGLILIIYSSIDIYNYTKRKK